MRALCRNFETEIFEILKNSIGVYLQEYAQNPQQNWTKKDIVYNLVCAMASKTVTARQGATSTSQLVRAKELTKMTKYVLDQRVGVLPELRACGPP